MMNWYRSKENPAAKGILKVSMIYLYICVCMGCGETGKSRLVFLS